MAIVKYTNPKTGLTYCYESTAQWDPEKGQSRPKRVYLGRWDEETQSIIKTDGNRGRKKKPADESSNADQNDPVFNKYKAAIDTLNKELMEVKEENALLKKRNQSLISLLHKIHIQSDISDK